MGQVDEDASGVVSLIEFTACCKALKDYMGSAAPPLCASATGVLQARALKRAVMCGVVW